MFWNIVQILGRGYLNWIEDILKELFMWLHFWVPVIFPYHFPMMVTKLSLNISPIHVEHPVNIY